MDAQSGPRSSWDYLDFDLEIREGESRGYAVAVRSPAGEAQEEMSFPFDERQLRDKLKDLEIALLRSGGTRRALSTEERTVQEFGRSLFEAVLVGKVGTCYYRSMDQAQQQGKGLRLKLHVEPPNLTVLPWEFLYDPDHEEYLCFSRDTPIVRYTDLHQPVGRLTVEPPLRILGMVASPRDLDPLDVGHEKNLMDEAIEYLQADGLVKLTWLEGETWRDLQRAMRRDGPWHIFHFVGHGDFDLTAQEGLIAFTERGTGRRHLLRSRDLARLLDGHPSLRLVFLNSCEGARGSEGDPFSGTAATLVRRGIPAVVAMQYQITDKAAIEFCSAFYESLADGLPVDAAVTEARVAVSMDSMLEWGTPVLYMRSRDGRLFDISTDKRPSEQPLDVREQEELHEDQERTAREKERKERLDTLYAQARRSHQNQEWQAVVDVFEQIRAEDSDYPDSEGLLASARYALEAQEYTQRVAALYDRGERHINAEEWQKALKCFEEIQRLEPGYQQTEELLSQVRKELALPPRVEVPSLVSQKVSRARSTLANKGLKLGALREAPSDTSPEGQIVEQSPEAGKEVQTGASVSVMVSSGPQEKAKAAPSGQSGAEAAQAQTASKDGSATADQREREPRRLAAWVIFASVAALAVLIVGALIVANYIQPQDKRSDRARNNPSPSRVAKEETPTFTLDRTLRGHSDLVNSVAFSPDGELLASSSPDGTVKVWGPQSGEELQTLKGHSDLVNSVAFSPDGELLASSSHDHTVKLWDPQSGKELRTLSGHSNSVKTVAFSPDGELLASGSYDETIKLWDPQSGKELRTLSGHSDDSVTAGGRVTAVAFSPDGELLASGSWDETIKLWDPQSGKELRTLKGHSDGVTAVAFSPDGELLAGGSHDHTVKLWDPQSGKELRTLSGHSKSVLTVAFSSGGKLLASGSGDETIKLWERAEAQQ